MSVVKKVWQKLHGLYAVRSGVHLGERVHIGIGSVLQGPSMLKIEDDVYIGKFCTLECDGRIGAHTMIANSVGIIGRLDHDYRVVGTTIRKAPHVWDADHRPGEEKLVVDIGEDVWIGYGATVLSGTRVGRGAIIAAGSVVSKDIDPYDIAAGAPARSIGRRFPSESVIREHESKLLQKYGIPLSSPAPASKIPA